MKTILKGLFPVLTIALLMISCSKKEQLAATNLAAEQTALAAFDARRPAIAEALMNYVKNSSPASAKPGSGPFIIPFFRYDSWGVMKLNPETNTYASVIFAATVTDKNDFYRLNNDGTVSVHISSKGALAQYYANSGSPTGLYLSATDANYSANYTGPVVDFPEYGIKFIDLDNGVPRAVSLHGNAKLFAPYQEPLYKLTAKVIQTPSGQTHREFLLR